jgi:prephenate dehydratase
MTIGYLGPAGTFTELAFKKFCALNKLPEEGVQASSIWDLFELFVQKKCDIIIVPIENSIEGSVSTTMDLIATIEKIYIQQEIILPIEHYLFAKNKMALSEVDIVTSHQQALSQCQHYLRRNLANALAIPTSSTANAAEFLYEKNAVIGSRELGALYNLELLAEGINDQTNNQTRFVAIGRTSTEPTGNDKTSIIISSIKDKPGGLVDMLTAFAKRNINLTRIESRPTRNVLGEYLFYIDCEGHEKDSLVLEALTEIKKEASYFKKLGSYKNDTTHA